MRRIIIAVIAGVLGLGVFAGTSQAAIRREVVRVEPVVYQAPIVYQAPVCVTTPECVTPTVCVTPAVQGVPADCGPHFFHHDRFWHFRR